MSSKTKTTKRTADVLIIGGGLSGLSAAKLLQEAGLNVLVLEARKRVGGRTFTVHNDQVNYVDLGAAYVGPTQNYILRKARELNIKTYLTHDDGDWIYHSKGKSRRFSGHIPPVGALLPWFDINNLFRLIDKMGQTIPLDAPWEAPNAEEWDMMTVQQFYNKHIWTKRALPFVEEFVQLNVTSEPYECSLLWFLWYVAQCGGCRRINSTTNGAQERKFIGGTQQISLGMAEQIGEDSVLLNCPVSKIEQQHNIVQVFDHNGNEYNGKYVILAVPPHLQGKILYDPPLPGLRNQLIQRLPMGSCIKTFMYYKRPFWRDNGICGSADIDDPDALVTSCVDHVQHDGSHPALMGFILADKARKCLDLTKEERKDSIARLYSRVFCCDEGLYPVHYEEKNWMEEQWSGGCYTAMMPPGFLTTFGKEIRRPFGRIYFAGTETATKWSGYMDGAIQAGERSAREILYHMGLATESEINQVEKEDPEVHAFPFEMTFMEKYAPSVPGIFRLMAGTSLLFVIGVAVIFNIKK